MEIREVNDKNQWENFLNDAQPHTFLQSWDWGEFNRRMGNKIWRLGIFEDSALVGVALIVKIEARRGSFLFCPHGPIMKSYEIVTHKIFFEYLTQLAKEEKVAFIRMSPLLLRTPENISIFREFGSRDAPVHMMHPERAWILDLAPPEEIILKNMRKQTRHCVKNAREAGVEIEISRDPKDVERFYAIHRATVARQNFTPFSLEYLKAEFETFARDNAVLLFFSKYRGETISSAFIVFAHSSAFYHHGASVLQYPKIPASHLVQWEVIREAKRRGLRRYNFWGIAPENALQHPWAGLTLFKKGFGGFAEDYVHAQDLVLSPGYWITYIIESGRRLRRRL